LLPAENLWDEGVRGFLYLLAKDEWVLLPCTIVVHNPKSSF
jgi:hypothetical protein